MAMLNNQRVNENPKRDGLIFDTNGPRLRNPFPNGWFLKWLSNSNSWKNPPVEGMHQSYLALLQASTMSGEPGPSQIKAKTSTFRKYCCSLANPSPASPVTEQKWDLTQPQLGNTTCQELNLPTTLNSSLVLNAHCWWRYPNSLVIISPSCLLLTLTC